MTDRSQAPTDRHVAPSAPAPRRTWPRLAAVVLVVVTGAVAAWGVASSARTDAARRERLVAEQTANLAQSTVQQLVAAISGASALADASGEVREEAFRAFAEGAADASPFELLAYAPVVPAGERAAFEAAAGRPIVDAPGEPPAAAQETYLPVRWIAPMPDEAEPLIGYDLLADDVRRATVQQARDAARAVVSPVVLAQADAQPSVVVAQPVYRSGADVATVAARRAAVVGFVVAGSDGNHLLDPVVAQIGARVGMRVEDARPAAGEPLTLFESDPPPGEGVVLERSVGGRPWRITVDDRRGVPVVAAWWLLAATLALAGTLAVLAWRAIRHQRQVGRHVVTVDRLAALGRSLGGVTSAGGVARVARTEVPAVLGAERADLALLPPAGQRAGAPGAEPGAASARAVGGTDDRAGRAPAPSTAARPDRGVHHAGHTREVSVRRRIPDATGAPLATLEVTWHHDTDLDDLTLAGLATVGEMCAQALTRAQLIDRTRRDAVSSRLLAGLAEAAATAGTTDQVALTLVERAAEVPGATSTHIGLLSDDGRSLVVVHQGLDEPGSHRTDLVPLDHPWPMVDAFRRNETVLVSDLDDAAARYPTTVAGMRASGLAAAASVPLVGADGRPFGAITLTWASAPQFDAALVQALQTTADLCASSLERARATDRAQAGTTALAALATHLSASRGFDEVGAAIVEHATAALHADFALVGVVEGPNLRLLAPDDARLDVLAPYREIALEGSFPALAALRSRRLVTGSSIEEIAGAETQLAGVLAGAGLHAAATAPMIGTDGEPSGVLIVLWSSPPTFDDDLRARIGAVADLCAQSAERSRLFDADRRVRTDLRRTVLPEPPHLDGLDLATRYVPAARSLGLGGDWYDAIALGDRRMCVVVGDVSGHGVGAVAAMTQVRTVVHTLVVGGMALPQILERTSVMVRREGLGYATVLLAVLDLGRGTIDYVTAGHPPPVLRQPGGAVHALTGGRHSLLGIDLTARPSGYVPFPVGASLVLYTDGLVERRDTAIATSIDELVVRVRTAGPLAPDALADELLAARPAVSSSEDDVALVVARRTA